MSLLKLAKDKTPVEADVLTHTATAGSDSVTAKAANSSKLAALILFLVTSGAAALHAHDTNITFDSATLSAIVVVATTAVGALAHWVTVYFTKNETPAERKIVLEALAFVRQLLPLVVATGQSVAGSTLALQDKLTKPEPEVVEKEVVKEVPAAVKEIDISSVLDALAPFLAPAARNGAGDVLASSLKG